MLLEAKSLTGPPSGRRRFLRNTSRAGTTGHGRAAGGPEGQLVATLRGSRARLNISERPARIQLDAQDRVAAAACPITPAPRVSRRKAATDSSAPAPGSDPGGRVSVTCIGLAHRTGPTTRGLNRNGSRRSRFVAVPVKVFRRSGLTSATLQRHLSRRLDRLP